MFREDTVQTSFYWNFDALNHGDDVVSLAIVVGGARGIGLAVSE
jgi:hypothetical protein